MNDRVGRGHIPRVAVGVGQAEQFTRGPEQAEVHPPGVHAEAGDGRTPRRGDADGEAQALLQVPPQFEQVPVQPRGQGLGQVGEAVDLFE